jgi:hypothetical protein
LCGTLPQCFNFLPEFVPLAAFRFRQFGQRLGTAHAGEVGVLEPVLHPLRDRGSGLACGFLHHLPIRLQIGAQPVQRLLAEAGAFFRVEVLRKCREFYRGLQGVRVRRRRHWRPASVAPEVEAVKLRGIREDEEAITDAQLSMEFTNGSRIISLPGSPDTIVGYSAISLLILDEAARIKDDLYALVRPMLAVSGGRLIALSTPFGKRGWFFSAWSRCDEARLRGQPEPWQRFRITAEECPRISAEFLAEERLAIGERWYRQEYETEFTDTIDAVFRSEDIEAMRGSTEKSLLEMCAEADAEWAAINRSGTPTTKAIPKLDKSLISDATPLLDL